MPLPLIESERRWADFQGGYSILMPDGDAWTFALPECTPSRGRLTWSFGPDVPNDLNAILSAKLAACVRKYLQAGDEADRACAAFEIAWFLLARNYSITPDEFESLASQAQRLDAAGLTSFLESLRAIVVLTIGRALLLREVL